MRIAVFTDSYRPQINGVVTSIDSVIDELKRRGHEVFIFAPSDPEAKKEKNVFRIRSFEFFGYKGYRIGLPAKLLVDFPIEKIRPDVIHIHSPFSVGMLGLKVAKQYKIPAVATFHTMYPDYMHYLFGSGLLKVKVLNRAFHGLSWKYIRWFHNMCDVVIAPTPAIKRILMRNGIKKNIAVIPTGTHLKGKIRDRSKIKEEKKLGNKRVILHVGRVTKEKNIDFMLKSLKKTLDGDKHVLIITSDGPYRKNLENFVRNDNIKNVVFTGFVSEKDLRDFYSAADVFVMASATETQGIVLMDAAALDVPSVVLDVPVISDFVRDNRVGIVAEKKNFAEKVKYVAENRASFSRGFEKVRKDYSLKKCVDDLVNLYHSQ